jgi:hypothetical protein
MAEPHRWFDSTQPQTLQGAVMLSYVIAAFGVLSLLSGAYPEVIALGLGAAGYGVANERRWGYWLGIVLAGLNVFVALLWVIETGFSLLIVNLMLMVVLFALFVHPQSREYQRIWFK